MRPASLVLVEFPSTTADFYPFERLHCLWEVRWGPWTLVEWWQSHLPETPIAVAVPPERQLWRRSFLRRFPEYAPAQIRLPALIVDARLVPQRRVIAQLRESWQAAAEAPLQAIYSGGELVGLWIAAPQLPPALAAVRDGLWTAECTAVSAELPRLELERGLPRLRFLWHAVMTLEEAFAEAEALLRLGVDPEPWKRQGTWIVAPERVWIAPTAELSPGVVLDARQGPIVIEEAATVQPGAVVMGPCFIGPHALVRAHATVGAYTVIGPGCRVGGEVAYSVFHAYANKQHEGFVGHSYIGSWVNFGAGTTTSNLKNTYGTVRLRLPEGELDTGMQFLGTLCGDHTKTAIGTYLRTGAVLGVSVNLLGGGMHAQHVPSFSWGDAAQPQPYQLEKALEVARRAMQRRGVELLPEEEVLLRTEYEQVWGVVHQV